MKQFLLILLVGLIASSFAQSEPEPTLNPELCQNPEQCHIGQYRMTGNLVCSDGIDNHSLNDIDLQSNGNFTWTFVGQYRFNNNALGFGTTRERTMQTFSGSCTGQWTKDQRIANLVGTCMTTEHVRYDSDFTDGNIRVAPGPRINTGVLDSLLDVQLMLPPGNNQTIIGYTSPDIQDALADATIGRLCSFQGNGVRLKDTNATMLPMIADPIDAPPQ